MSPCKNLFSAPYSRNPHASYPTAYLLASDFMAYAGEQKVFTSSHAQFTTLLCAQVTSELLLHVVLMTAKDESKRLRRDSEAVSGPGQCFWMGSRAVPFVT